MPGETQLDEAARLEAALLRIQAATHRRTRPADPARGAAPDTGELASRLDALIAELRALLAPPP